MTRETKSYELKIYGQSLMRFEAVYDAFGSLKLEITDIDSGKCAFASIEFNCRSR